MQIKSSHTSESPSYSISSGDTTVGTGSELVPRVDRIIKLIDGVSPQDFSISSDFTDNRFILKAWIPILESERASTFAAHDWRVNVRKLAMLARLQKGWDYPESQPLERGAQANYLDWVAMVPLDRMADAEPMLTDDGNIRLEWRREGYARIAEIGPDSLYLAVLAPDSEDDDAEEYSRCDLDALTRFFLDGAIRP
ncbi:hypothetical protein MM1218R_01457 [Mycobacterium marinum]|nr:hypothetical protein [Mycobacterium marinum]AXN43405.1 hypothetical protein MM1218R_01457 [Mycobacterium marinum]RFZ11542.1 hypothetical protein DE4381_01130 [Mycobacterium marinum]